MLEITVDPDVGASGSKLVTYEQVKERWESGWYEKIFTEHQGRDPKEVLKDFLAALARITYKYPENLPLHPWTYLDWALQHLKVHQLETQNYEAKVKEEDTENVKKLIQENLIILNIYYASRRTKELAPNFILDCIKHTYLSLLYLLQIEDEDFRNNDIHSYWLMLEALIVYPRNDKRELYHSDNAGFNDIMQLFVLAQKCE